MKLSQIVLALIFFVVATPAPGQTSDLRARSPQRQDSHQSPEAVVREYYTAYLAWLTFFEKKENRQLPPGDGVPNKSLDPQYVTDHFIEAYRKLKAADQRVRDENKGEIGFLDYDPLLCAQYYPDDMANASVVLVQQTGRDAVVKVNLDGTPKPDYTFTVKLKKQKEGWRINAIICPLGKYHIE